MKATLSREKSIHYINSSDLIKFICENSDMKWNDACTYASTSGILTDNYKNFYKRSEFANDLNDVLSTVEAYYFMKGFFEAHPWLENIMIVFDD